MFDVGTTVILSSPLIHHRNGAEPQPGPGVIRLQLGLAWPARALGPAGNWFDEDSQWTQDTDASVQTMANNGVISSKNESKGSRNHMLACLIPSLKSPEGGDLTDLMGPGRGGGGRGGMFTRCSASVTQ